MSAQEVARRLPAIDGRRWSARRVRMIPPAQLPYVQLEARGRRAYAEEDVETYLERRTIRE